MNIESIKTFRCKELLAAVARTPLRGYNRVQPYAHASLELAAIDPAELTPAQNYVLKPNVRKILELQAALSEHDHDVFALEGGLHIRTSDNPQETVPLIPPVVEQSREPDGRTVLLVNDGMHRIFAARALGRIISVILIQNVPPEFPYYAYALREGWLAVDELEVLPEVHQKKEYRQPENYKALFRDFNTIFPGVQKQRKQSNPEHISE
jgi:hypothetical protein